MGLIIGIICIVFLAMLISWIFEPRLNKIEELDNSDDESVQDDIGQTDVHETR